MPSEAEIVRLWAARGVALLKAHINELNALNVFPVADQDTGTNLYLTFESSKQAESSRGGGRDDLVDALSALAKGAVLGARGNSGVILAEAFVGVVEGLSNPNYTVSTLLKSAADKARESVQEPQPGTMLTLFDSVAALGTNNLETIAAEARKILIETRDLLPELKQAGVVDAGGRGVVILLDALVQVCQGVEQESPPVGLVPMKLPVAVCEADRKFEVILKTDTSDMKTIQERLHTLGTSITTTSDSEITLVHIHTDEPKSVINAVSAKSRVWDVKIESLQPATSMVGCTLLVEGIGNVMNFVSMGATVINQPDPSPENIAEALLKSNHREVILLIDNTAENAALHAIRSLSEFDVSVHSILCPSLVSMYAGFSVFDAGLDIEKNMKVIENTIASVYSIIVNRLEDLGLNAEKLTSAELVTIVWGEKADHQFKDELRMHVSEYSPKAEIIEFSGDQQASRAEIGVE